MTTTNPFANLAAGRTDRLVPTNGQDATHHLWSQPEIDALTLAFAARRPLLVRGEPGSGKSQLARAAAHILQSGAPVVEVIHPRFEPLDLLYRFDALKRLADAQAQNHSLDETGWRYVDKGALWRVFDHAQGSPTTPVLLIDEIDKADADVPNSLLEVMGNRSFSVPVLNPAKRVVPPEGLQPLVLITTNEERELPAAFVRRCVVLNLNPPESEAALQAWLKERARAHDALQGIDDEALNLAIRQLMADRVAAHRAGYPKVGLAELMDLLLALAELTADTPEAERDDAQVTWLQRLSAYALVKHAKQDQRRPMVAAQA